MIQTLSADGNSSAITTNDKVHVHLSGSFGGGTAKVQYMGENGTWYDIAGASYTAAADEIIELGKSQYNLRVNLASSTTPSLVVNLRG
jgi:ribosomal protein L21E